MTDKTIGILVEAADKETVAETKRGICSVMKSSNDPLVVVAGLIALSRGLSTNISNSSIVMGVEQDYDSTAQDAPESDAGFVE